VPAAAREEKIWLESSEKISDYVKENPRKAENIEGTFGLHRKMYKKLNIFYALGCICFFF